MTDETTPLDAAHAAMDADTSDDASRLRFFQRLADSELLLMLESEPGGAELEPYLIEIDNPDTANIDRFALVFDREARMGSFAAQTTGQPMPYAALPGRVIAAMLAEQGIGLALNLDVAPSSALIPASAMAWLADVLAQDPEGENDTLISIAPPVGLPDALIEGLEEKLVSAAGLASHAVFARGTWTGGREGWLLAFIDAAHGAERALARATHEALLFSGTDLASVDVAFFASDDPICEPLDHVGLRYDFPDPEAAGRDEDGVVETPAGPGLDKDKPPILR
jgi:hypothetical protein